MTESRAERVTREILEGSTLKALFMLGWPIMVTTLLQTFYNLADSYWVGHIRGTSRQALAALNTSWPVVFLMISLGTGFGVAGTAYVSQARGAQRHDIALKATNQLFSLAMIFALSLSLTGFFITPFILEPIGLEPQVFALAKRYLSVIFLGVPLMFLTMLFSTTLRGLGETVIPMVVNGSTVVANAILDPFLIFGWGPFPELGVLGAAVATVSMRGVAASASFFILRRGISGLRLEGRLMRPDKGYYSRLLRVSLPASAGNSLMALGFYFLMFIIARVQNATTALAAYGLGDRIIHLMFIAVDGIAFGLATVIGQNVGARNFGRAWRAFKEAMLISFAILGVEGLAIFFGARPAMAFFTNSQLVVEEGTRFMRIFVIGIPFFGVWRVVRSLYNGVGMTEVGLALAMARLWGLRLPLAYLLGIAMEMQSVGVWWGMTLSNVFGALIALSFLYAVDWRKSLI